MTTSRSLPGSWEYFGALKGDKLETLVAHGVGGGGRGDVLFCVNVLYVHPNPQIRARATVSIGGLIDVG